MAKKKEQKKVSQNEENIKMALRYYMNNTPLKYIFINRTIVSKEELGKDIPAKVSSSGMIYINKDCNKTVKEWLYIIAHCVLHLCFGHFDSERMPGYFQQIDDNTKKWINDYNPELWNMACDIYITRFLLEVKIGVSDINLNHLNDYKNSGDEIAIYESLLANNVDVGKNIFGTAGKYPDMIDVDKPLVYKNGKNEYMKDFAHSLEASVKSAINKASYNPIERHVQTKIEKAASWFINHYPLLGGIATGFKIIEIRERRDLYDIEIAAINVVDGEIYVNSSVKLDRDEWKFVLAHEYLHAGLQHHARRNGRNHYLWNIACDFMINNWLVEMEIGSMPQNGLLYDETLKNLSAEEIYDRLVENIRKNSKLGTFRGYGKGDIIDDGWLPDANGSTSLDDFCKSALRSGLEYHNSKSRGFIPYGLIEEIKALSMPPVPWDVELAKWFDCYFTPLEKHRTYARPSRRQSSTPDIPRPSWVNVDIPDGRTYGVIIDTSCSMSTTLIGKALGATVSYSVAKDVPYVRVVFCDANAYDIGYVAPEDIAGRVIVKGRGGTVLQPAVDLLEKAKDFPKNAPILIITDAEIENNLKVHHEHAFLIPAGERLPFRPCGKVFYFK